MYWRRIFSTLKSLLFTSLFCISLKVLFRFLISFSFYFYIFMLFFIYFTRFTSALIDIFVVRQLMFFFKYLFFFSYFVVSLSVFPFHSLFLFLAGGSIGLKSDRPPPPYLPFSQFIPSLDKFHFFLIILFLSLLSLPTLALTWAQTPITGTEERNYFIHQIPFNIFTFSAFD